MSALRGIALNFNSAGFSCQFAPSIDIDHPINTPVYNALDTPTIAILIPLDPSLIFWSPKAGLGFDEGCEVGERPKARRRTKLERRTSSIQDNDTTTTFLTDTILTTVITLHTHTTYTALATIDQPRHLEERIKHSVRVLFREKSFHPRTEGTNKTNENPLP